MAKQNEAYKRWEDAVHAFLLLKDPYIIKLVPALLLTHRLPGDPVWAFLVAPPGGSKTEFIKAMTGIESVYPISSLTSKTLVSGAKTGGKNQASLLMRVQDGYLTFEDFTTLASEHRDETSAIMGQLRAIYGGKFDKEFGTGETISWEGKITLIAGATHAIHAFRSLFSNMGERFLIYQIEQPGREDAAMRTMENHETGDVHKMRGEMAAALKHLIDEVIEIPEKMPKVSTNMRKELVDIAEFTTRARSTVERDWRSPKKEIIEVYPPEMPTRFAAQLQKLAEALMIINYHINGRMELLVDDNELLKKIGFDSISITKRKVLIELAKFDRLEGPALAVKLNMPSATIDRWLQDFNALEIVERSKTGRANVWTMKEKYRKLVAHFENVEITGGTYTEALAYEETGLHNPDDWGLEDQGAPPQD